MENINMRKKGKYLSLQVPGLAEKRPSLVHGDHIFAKLACEDASGSDRVYEVWFTYKSTICFILLSLKYFLFGLSVNLSRYLSVV